MDHDDERYDRKKPAGEEGDEKGRGRGAWIILVVAGLIAIVLLFGGQITGGNGAKSITESEFNKLLFEDGKMKSAEYDQTNDVITGEFVEGYDERTYKVAVHKNWYEVHKEEIRELSDFSMKEPPNAVLQFLMTVLPWVLFFVIAFFLMTRLLRGPASGGGSILSFSRSKARRATKGKHKITFDDVAGVEEAKEEVEEVVEFLKNPTRFQEIGARMPHGLLLLGSPGCGKTLLAKAIAGEADVPFFSISGSDFMEMFVGVGASRVRDLFKQARANSPCIIFLDEIDAIGRKRDASATGGGEERSHTLNAILVEMDGFDSDERIVVIAATNRPDVLDPALIRPGRFDRQIAIDLPDIIGREHILEVHARHVKLADDVDLKRIAQLTPTFSGAELANLINEGALLAVIKGKKKVFLEDLEEARDKVRFGRQKKRRVLSDEDRKVTAYHEAGHAIIAHLLPEVDPLHKVTIIPRGIGLGATMIFPEKDRYNFQTKNVLGLITMALGGRAAETLFFSDISTGAANDFERATALARKMVCEWGMSPDVGLVTYKVDESQFIAQKPYSEDTSRAIDLEIKRVIDECYSTAVRIIEENRDAVEKIATALLKYEVLKNIQVLALLNGETIESLADLINEVPENKGDPDTIKPPTPSDPSSDPDESRRE